MLRQLYTHMHKVSYTHTHFVFFTYAVLNNHKSELRHSQHLEDERKAGQHSVSLGRELNGQSAESWAHQQALD